MKVKVMKLGHSTKEVDVAAGSTVEDVVTSSGMQQDGYSITVNGVGAMLSAQIQEGDVVALVPKVDGGL